MNIFDYLKWRGDVPLSVCPFNEADNLILAELAYTDFGDVVPCDGRGITLEDAADRFFAAHDRKEILASKSYTAQAPLLMEEMRGAARFGGTRIAFYEKETDPQADLQFSAVTFFLPDGTACAAFRGTDGTLVGWKEDFLFSYLSGTRGQQRAVEYLNRVGRETSGPLRACGHSKGGNLAVYAAALCDRETQDRLLEVYSDDGPGFRPELLAEEGYARIRDRIVCIVPDTSVIGMLMETGVPPRVIRSSASGILQHDGFTWETERGRFVPAELSETSRLIRRTLSGWLDRTDEKDRQAMVETVFALLESTGEESFSGINGSRWKSAEAIAASARKLPKGSLQEIGRLVNRLGQSGIETASAYLQDRAADKLQSLLGGPRKETDETEGQK